MKEIYGLEESRKLANIKLQTIFASEGYKQYQFTYWLYRHKTRNITFSLLVDNFGVTNIEKKVIDHLIKTLQKNI